jgi:hypothetical protein
MASVGTDAANQIEAGMSKAPVKQVTTPMAITISPRKIMLRPKSKAAG